MRMFCPSGRRATAPHRSPRTLATLFRQGRNIDGRPIGKLGDQSQTASHGRDIAAQCRQQEIASLFEARNAVLSDAEKLRHAFAVHRR